MNPAASIPTVSVVIIGRNEGERLRQCLASVDQADWQGLSHDVWYVDSRSSDDSMRVAGEAGANCILLDDPSPCAAKARNLGWTAARGEFILFLDGDTQLAPGFVRAALAALDDPTLCAAWGHRRESNPGQSIYTRVLDLDWVYPAGRSLYFGGDVLVRRSALEQVGGFDPSLKAGEEPEMCARLRAHGWQIEHLDEPMTRHDLAVRSLRAYLLRCYRSGIAYAEVAHRMSVLGDCLWQREATRDFRHGVIYALFPFALLLALWLQTSLALGLLGLAALVIARSAWRCRDKAAGDALLCIQYALHSHLQKLPALAGQLAWRRAHAASIEVGLVDYKDGAAAPRQGANRAKPVLAWALTPLAWANRVAGQRWLKLWRFSCLQEAIGRPLDATNIVLGRVELQGTRNISIGRNALIYPGVYLETQGAGRIDIGDNVVLSTGVHLVAFDHMVIEDNTMVGEYSSIRDANHVASPDSMRNSGHQHAPIRIGANVWIGRGVTVLKGASIGRDCIVGANAVVTRPLPAGTRAAGVPARALQCAAPL